ncbi:MAG: hypothetical protein JWM80_387 [Cyanobacteria bacterium RYN_339]|nr:hypothetical protein [Cyanobacteria bacterium RYN_339]
MKTYLIVLALLAGCQNSDPIGTAPVVIAQPIPNVQTGPIASIKLISFPGSPGLRIDRYTVERSDLAGKVTSPKSTSWLSPIVTLPAGQGELTFPIEVGSSAADMINCRVTLFGSTLAGLPIEIPLNVPIRGGTPSDH